MYIITRDTTDGCPNTQQIIDKMEAAGLIEKVEVPRPLRFNFENVDKLPPAVPLHLSGYSTHADYSYPRRLGGVRQEIDVEDVE